MEYKITEESGVAQVALAGAINEDAELNLQALTKELAGKSKVTFNFANVKSINSLGVRAWVMFLRGLDDGREISFQECPPDVIMQINMIPSFLGRARVGSFYTNYICENCDFTQKILIDTSTLKPKSLPPPQACPKCQTEMETEELEEEYFAFLVR